MYYEKWGFMLIFWNLAGVPLSYCHCTIYLANHDPSEYHWNRYFLAFLYIAYLFVYWVWDTTNSQKNRFRQQERGTMVKRNTFPQLPWQTVENPKTLSTADGSKILVDGWYGKARKIHYTCDLFFALNWGLITGFSSPFPWFYPLFFACMISHRALRDIQRCRIKYGETWAEYERQVPYLFIPVSLPSFHSGHKLEIDMGLMLTFVRCYSTSFKETKFTIHIWARSFSSHSYCTAASGGCSLFSFF